MSSIKINIEKIKKRDLILQAAIEKFIQKDFYIVKMEEIAEHAGVGKGTIYEYFSSKEELFIESFSDWIAKYEIIFIENYVQPDSIKDSLISIMKIHLRFFKENSHWVRFLFNERPSSIRKLDDLLAERRKQQLQGIEALLFIGIENGEIRPNLDVKISAQIFLTLSFMVMGGMLVMDNIEPDMEKVEQMFDFFWRGVVNNDSKI